MRRQDPARRRGRAVDPAAPGPDPDDGRGEGPPGKPYWVYMLECAGGVIYTGVAIDPEARFEAHRAGKGARFTRMRKPLRILGMREYPDRGSALRAEIALKKLPPREKRRWADGTTSGAAPRRGS